jgi:hypothetical protein
LTGVETATAVGLVESMRRAAGTEARTAMVPTRNTAEVIR